MFLASPALAGRFFTTVPPGKPVEVGDLVPISVHSSERLVLGLLLFPGLSQSIPVSSGSPCKQAGALWLEESCWLKRHVEMINW